MEGSEEKKRAVGILKTSKKGVKKAKALSAEEEARRREAVKEALREKLELEKRALQIVERLLEDSVAEDFLIDCARFIAPANYKDTVEERSIAKLCGYPICPNKLGKIPTQQYKISTKTNKVYDITERKLYCSNFCYKASKQFELQISKTPLWLRKHERPTEITLMKKGDSGSSGEEVKLSERRLQEEDIENPSSTQTEDSRKSGSPHDSDNSENEQDFVSSVVSKKGGPSALEGHLAPRVHWGDMPKRKKVKTQNTAGREDKRGQEVSNQDVNGNKTTLDEATVQLNSCSLSDKSKVDTNSSVESKQEEVLSQNNDSATSSLDITQVGMSKKGAEGLRNLLKQHGSKPDSIRNKLLGSLKKTLREWCTAETQLFLYGSERSVVKPEGAEEEEELDEDDIEEEEEEGDRGAATEPDYETLRKEAQEMQQKVKEFYKGAWGTEAEERAAQMPSEKPAKEPVLPLVDSKAQHVIQKKITVDKLCSCLKNIVCHLGLTMNDISTDLNNLVRTFRFSNTNIIHKTPAWTLIAVVLLHLLSEVSPLVRQSLQQDSSVLYLQTLMTELELTEEDLLSLVHVFKSQTN